jgi:hypothetical protein
VSQNAVELVEVVVVLVVVVVVVLVVVLVHGNAGSRIWIETFDPFTVTPPVAGVSAEDGWMAKV